MRKLLPFVFTLFAGAVFAQTTSTCNDFSTSNGLSKYPSNSTQVSYSVSNGELTIDFSSATFWGDEIKIDFPAVVDVSAGSLTIDYDVKIVNLTINGTGCGSINYLPLGMSLYDVNYNYTSGTASTGYYQTSYVAGSNDIVYGTANVDYTQIKGVSIKPSDFTSQGCTPASVTGQIVIDNIRIGNTNCSTLNTASPVSLNTDLTLFPNPVSDKLTIAVNTQNQISRIAILDILGNEVMVVPASSGKDITMEIEVASLSSGIYTVNVMSEGRIVSSKRFIK